MIVYYGERNHKNVVNVPLFIPYLYTNNFINCLTNKQNGLQYLIKMYALLRTNPGGGTRNKFLQSLDKLSKYLTVDYAGR